MQWSHYTSPRSGRLGFPEVKLGSPNKKSFKDQLSFSIEQRRKNKDQGCALRKILGSPSGTQTCRLGFPENKLGSPNKKK